MRIIGLAGMLGAAAVIHAGPEKAAPPARLPLELPGFELRTLEAQKSVRFRVGGADVEVAVPLFVYLPKTESPTAARALRAARAALLALAAKPEWKAEELQQIITRLEESARTLDVPIGFPAGPGK